MYPVAIAGQSTLTLKSDGYVREKMHEFADIKVTLASFSLH